jgi:hypothetical protein
MLLKNPFDRSPETISLVWKSRATAQTVDLSPNGKSTITLAAQ